MGQELNKCGCIKKDNFPEESLTTNLKKKGQEIDGDIFKRTTTVSINLNNSGTYPQILGNENKKPSKLEIFQGFINVNDILSTFKHKNKPKPEIRIQRAIRAFLYRKTWPQTKSKLSKEHELDIKKYYKKHKIDNINKLEKEYEYILSHNEICSDFLSEYENDIKLYRMNTDDYTDSSYIYSTKCLQMNIEPNVSALYIGSIDVIDNTPHGEGVLYTSNGVLKRGRFVYGAFTGWGKLLETASKLYYQGTFVNSNLSGKGIKLSIINDILTTYVGDIKNNSKEGKGKEDTVEYIYDGLFKNNKKHGKGKLQYKINKDSYQGEFNEGNITGYGFYVWKNQHTYMGDFVNGQMHGKGVYKWPDGEEYEGEYVNNIKEGKGVFKWGDGRVFKGGFHDGKPHGKGILEFKGAKMDAEFNEGKLIGDLKEMMNNNNNNNITKHKETNKRKSKVNNFHKKE